MLGYKATRAAVRLAKKMARAQAAGMDPVSEVPNSTGASAPSDNPDPRKKREIELQKQIKGLKDIGPKIQNRASKAS